MLYPIYEIINKNLAFCEAIGLVYLYDGIQIVNTLTAFPNIIMLALHWCNGAT